MLLDSYAWLEYFAGSEAGARVRRHMSDAPVIHTAPIVLAEVYSKVARTSGHEAADQALRHILDRSAVTPADEDIALAAARIHVEGKAADRTFGMADAFVLATARFRGVRVLTGDPHFRLFDDAVML